MSSSDIDKPLLPQAAQSPVDASSQFAPPPVSPSSEQPGTARSSTERSSVLGSRGRVAEPRLTRVCSTPLIDAGGGLNGASPRPTGPRAFLRSRTAVSGTRRERVRASAPVCLQSAFADSPSHDSLDQVVVQRKLQKAGFTRRNLARAAGEMERMATVGEMLEMQADLPSSDLDASCEHLGAPLRGVHRSSTPLSPVPDEPSSLLHEDSALVSGPSAQIHASRHWAVKPRFKRKHVAQAVFALVCLLASIAAWLVDRHRAVPHRFASVRYATWFLIAASIVPTVRLCGIMVDLFIRFFEVVFAKVENIHYVLIGTSRGLRLLFSITVFMAVVKLLLARDHHHHNKPILRLIFRVSKCAVIFALVEVIKRLGCRILSLRVHSHSLFAQLRAGKDRVASIAQAMNVPVCSVNMYLSKLRSFSLSMDSQQMSLTRQITRLIRQFEGMDEATVDSHARKAAEYFWWTSREDVTSYKLVKEDLQPYLGSEAEVDYMFRLFDQNGDGFVVFEEVQQQFVNLYRERRNVASTLQDTNTVMKTLEALVGCILHAAALFAYMAIFGVNVGHLILSLSSFAIASAFIFGNTLRTIYESVVFLFLVHPYQVGDRIMYDDMKHTVINFGLMATQFYRYDGSKIWIPNEKLMNNEILNVTQSRNYQDRIYFEVDARLVTEELVDDLTDRLEALIHSEEDGHHFDPTFEPFAHVAAVHDPLKFQIGVIYRLAFNMHSYKRVSQARTQVNFVISQWQEAHSLVHSQSIQPGFTLRHREGVPGGLRPRPAHLPTAAARPEQPTMDLLADAFDLASETSHADSPSRGAIRYRRASTNA